MGITALTRPAATTATIHHRKQVEKLTDDQLKDYRDALDWMIARPVGDQRGYWWFAGWHGVPRHWCIHHEQTPLFLPWHRQYLLAIEHAIQKALVVVRGREPEDTESWPMLPWWDWTVASDIPTPFKELSPLTGVEIPPIAPDAPSETTRAPGDPRVPPLPYDDLWDAAMNETTFAGFAEALIRPHDLVHVWTGGEMSATDYAAYDPLFWSHHAMVDRAWALWQNSPNGADPAPELLDVRMIPTGRTVRELLSINQLGYDYAGTTAHVEGTL